MRSISRSRPKGARPAPLDAPDQMSLGEVMGRNVEIFLHSEPYMVDATYVCKLLYLTSAWLGIVRAYRTRLFYEHIPLTTIRKIRGALKYRKKVNEEHYAPVDYDDPEKITDLIGNDVVVLLQGHPLRTDSGFKARLVYVKKRWIGTTSTFGNRVLPDHFPLTSIRKVSKVVPIGR